jgi:hypothetical protein
MGRSARQPNQDATLDLDLDDLDLDLSIHQIVECGTAPARTSSKRTRLRPLGVARHRGGRGDRPELDPLGTNEAAGTKRSYLGGASGARARRRAAPTAARSHYLRDSDLYIRHDIAAPASGNPWLSPDSRRKRSMCSRP